MDVIKNYFSSNQTDMQSSTSKFIDFLCLFKEHFDDSDFKKPIATEKKSKLRRRRVKTDSENISEPYSLVQDEQENCL
jgi:hypothetical protein